MFSKWFWLLSQLNRTLWVRASLFALLGIAAALAAVAAESLLPPDLPTVGAESVDRILQILASSMLAVTTFSLSVMVSAYSAATASVSPRATRLLMQDTTTQNVLATFIGSFLFSLVGIISLSTGFYGQGGQLVLFLVTLVVIALIVITLLRWIEHLSRLGRVGETTDRVEEAARQAIADRAAAPCLGGRAFSSREQLPADATLVHAGAIGYVQHLDMGALDACSREGDCEIYVLSLPGSFVHEGRPLAGVVGGGEATAERIRAAFTVGEARSFDQDPRFGLVVLAEIASRSLSPALNDPGTAIDVIGRVIRLLALWAQRQGDDEEVQFPGVRVPPLDTADLFYDTFTPIGRDGAGLLEVQMRLQKAMLALAAMGDAELRRLACEHSAIALKRAEAALTLEEDLSPVRQLADRLASGESTP